MLQRANHGLEDQSDNPRAESTVGGSAADREGSQAEADEREATELSVYTVRTATDAGSSTTAQDTWISKYISRPWGRNISLSVPHKDCRDHLANERTYLAWLRTSLTLSMMGTVTAQLFRIEIRAPIYPTKLGYFELGKPLGIVFQAAAMVTVAIACHRYLAQQLAMARGRARSGGWEIHVVTFGIVLLVLVTLILMVNAEKWRKP